MITFDSVGKSYRRRAVLAGVSLQLRPGAVTALIGPNGSGKTTLVKLLLGLARPDHGEVRVDGTLIDGDGAYRHAIGYMPQIARFPEHLRVRDLLEMVTTLRSGVAANDELLNAFRLDAELEKPLGALSGGTRQKVNAAIAFRFDPRIVVLDEPTAGLDPVASRILKDRIRQGRAEGATVLITSHLLNELEELADDVAFLYDGRVQFAGPLVSLLGQTTEDNLENAIASLMSGGTISYPPQRVTDNGAVLALVQGGGR
jgi:Cu-processing system ATP-binding protein